MNRPHRSLRLGTRSSPLAVAQSRRVADALRALEPDTDIELVRIETRGDRDRVTPLEAVRDADFFSAELDHALINGDIDFTVHSMKDLGSERPDALTCAAIPPRENPRDAIVFRSGIEDRLRRGLPIRIGSSSQRRRVHVAKFLLRALPDFGRAPDLHFAPLRGPVDVRVARIDVAEDNDEALDGVVLALAGLQRLWLDDDGRRLIEPALARARWMVLPLTACPAAPAQGALALECRHADHETRTLLARLHDAPTAEAVARELAYLRDGPDAGQSALGATAIGHERLDGLLFVADHNGPRVVWNTPPRPARISAWDGGRQRATTFALPIDHPLADGAAIFAAHWRAINDTTLLPDNARLWVSGERSWQALARQGLWVEGCAENLGFRHIVPTLELAVLNLPALQNWMALTRAGSEGSWRGSGVGHIRATYRHEPAADDESRLRTELGRHTDFFWGSIEQFDRVRRWLPRDARHACGAGKTADALAAAGVETLLTFPSRAEWERWLN